MVVRVRDWKCITGQTQYFNVSVMDEDKTNRPLVSNIGSPRMERHGQLPLYRRYTYGVGHVFNDLCASMWFTYMILFYHMVLRLSNAYAGLIVLVGQAADALATPVVGYLCDKTENKYGGRKSWHLVGTIMVACSLFFFWHHCIYCSNQPLGYQVLYYSCFIIVFQVGWATVQISHLALIPELTDNESERVGLNSIRYHSHTIRVNMIACYSQAESFPFGSKSIFFFLKFMFMLR